MKIHQTTCVHQRKYNVQCIHSHKNQSTCLHQESTLYGVQTNYSSSTHRHRAAVLAGAGRQADGQGAAAHIHQIMPINNPKMTSLIHLSFSAKKKVLQNIETHTYTRWTKYHKKITLKHDCVNSSNTEGQ